MRVRSVFRTALMLSLVGASFNLGLVAVGDDRIGGQFGGSAPPYGWNLPSSGFHNPVPSFGGSIQPYYGGGAVAPYYSGGPYYYGGLLTSPRVHTNSWSGGHDNFKFNTIGPPSPYSPIFLRGSVAGLLILPPQSFAASYSAPSNFPNGRFRYRPLNYGYDGLTYGPTGFGYSRGLGKSVR